MPVKPRRAAKHGSTDWLKQQRFDIEFAKRILFEAGGVNPMFVIHAPDGTLVLSMPWDDNQQKQLAYQLITLKAAAVNAEGITFIGEAWMRTVRHLPGETELEARTRAEAIAPSQAEDREEVVMIATVYRDADGKHSHYAMLNIERGADGKPSAAPERPQDSDGEYTGVVANLLLEEPLADYQRSVAGRLYDELLKATGLKTHVMAAHAAGHA